MVIVPVVAFVTCWVALVSRRSRLGLREAFLVSALIWGVIATLIIEGSSLVNALAAPAVAGAWLIVIVVALAATSWSGAARRWRDRSRITVPWVRESPVLIGLCVVGGVLALVAITGGISTNDVLDYHLPRVMHWIQNRDVSFYPTAVSRQLNSGPWSSYAITQFFVLGGADAWANLVQWFAFVGCAIGSSVVARQFGAGPSGQICAAVFAATIPMAVLQGATAQNDLCVAFWVVTLAWALLRLAAPDRRMTTGQVLRGGVLAGAALGLALLTKSTGFLFAGTVVAALGLLVLGRHRWRIVLMGIAGGLTVIVLNAPFWLRNHALYGSPLGPGQESPPGQTWGRYTNDDLSLDTLISNVVRFLALNVNPPSHEGAARVTAWVVSFLEGLGIDPNDPGTTWAGQTFSVAPLHTNEDGAGNLIHLVLIGLVLIALPLVPALRRWAVVLYAGAALAGFLTFCLMLKWSPWSTRLYLTSLILFAPVIGLAVSQIRYAWIPRVAMVALLLTTAPYLLFAQHRPVLGGDIYQPAVWEVSTVGDGQNADLFVTRPQLADDFATAITLMEESRCGQIGLWRFDASEYPARALLGASLPEEPRLQHIGVINDTRPLSLRPPYYEFAPCLVIGLRQYVGDPPTTVIDRRAYTRVWSSDAIVIYRPSWYLE
ncbi:MAG TPA: hypothetical protein VGT61_08650 [Thermomicrobiales bacterium]|jgi:4-amino-4-deoxy-L-arabinose transferase-like glycosyltransferase|nr:hypothetical protein [Thermomicrobiales bacterium]